MARNYNAEKPCLTWVAIAVSVAAAIFPIYYLFLTSIKPTGLLFAIPPRFFFTPTLGAYKQIFFREAGIRYLMNSLVVSVTSTALATILGAMPALVLALLNFRFKGVIFFLVLITRMYPPITTLIPVYMLMRSIGLYDTQLSLILPYAGAQMALATWIMWSFYQDLPSELFEAALLDGCSPWKLLARIALPLSKAGLLACAILIFVLTWSEFLFALVLTSTKSRTATVALMSFLEQEGMIQWCSLATIGTMMVLPIMLFVFLFRKYLISGLTVGAVKS